MVNGQLDIVVRHLHRLAGAPEGEDFSDGQLLERFAGRGEEAAFAALLRRHGPMVLGVCRRVLRHEADAEDAFQAAFLVLVRKAASITPRSRLAAWLYGVAHHTALKARAMRSTRQAKERRAAQGSASASLPPPLVAATVQAATAAGPAAGAVSATAAALVEKVVRSMFLSKLKVVTAAVLAAALAVAAVAWVRGPGRAEA